MLSKNFMDLGKYIRKLKESIIFEYQNIVKKDTTDTILIHIFN